MANISLYFDKKTKKVTLNFSHLGSHSRKALPVSVEPSQWSQSKQEVINHPQAKSINIYLKSFLSKAQLELLNLSQTERIRSLTSSELRDMVCDKIFDDGRKKDNIKVYQIFEREIKGTRIKQHTKNNYGVAIANLRSYCSHFDSLSFDDLTAKWINDYKSYLEKKGLSNNSIFSYISPLRAVFKIAYDEEITENTPFRRVKIRLEETKKRNLTKEQLVKIINYKGSIEEQNAVDYFTLTFLLIGINPVDICSLPKDAYSSGRIEYVRNKTNRFYSIKVEEEAKDIIRRHKGKTYLLDFYEQQKRYENINREYNTLLKNICKKCNIPPVTTYWARHSWASIAFNDCDIEFDTVSLALGHSFGVKVTQTYVNKNMKKVDKANRKVIDYVFDKDTENE